MTRNQIREFSRVKGAMRRRLPARSGPCPHHSLRARPSNRKARRSMEDIKEEEIDRRVTKGSFMSSLFSCVLQSYRGPYQHEVNFTHHPSTSPCGAHCAKKHHPRKIVCSSMPPGSIASAWRASKKSSSKPSRVAYQTVSVSVLGCSCVLIRLL